MQKSLPKVFESSDSPRAFREMFKERWAAYLKEHYKTPENVAVAFGVRYQTAVNWMDAVNRASGDVIALEATRNPEAFSRYMKGAA